MILQRSEYWGENKADTPYPEAPGRTSAPLPELLTQAHVGTATAATAPLFLAEEDSQSLSLPSVSPTDRLLHSSISRATQRGWGH